MTAFLRRAIKSIQLVLGGIILSGGLAVAAVAASNEHFLGVFMGFTVFVIGYEMSQYSVYKSDGSRLHGFVADLVESSQFIDLLMIIVGIGTTTYGFTLLFRSMETTDLSLAVFSTMILFGGYALAHFGVNKTVI